MLEGAHAKTPSWSMMLLPLRLVSNFNRKACCVTVRVACSPHPTTSLPDAANCSFGSRLTCNAGGCDAAAIAATKVSASVVQIILALAGLICLGYIRQSAGDAVM